MLSGGCNAISRHSAARSTTSRTSRISAVSSTAPTMRDFFTGFEMSSKPENSKRPPTRRNSRISAVKSCCSEIQAESVEGTSAAILALPSGEGAYPRSSSRRASNSSTRAELWMSGSGIRIYVTGRVGGKMRRLRGDLRLNRGQRLGSIGVAHGQAQHEYRSAFRLVLAGDLSLMILHHAVDGAESQAGALADGLRSVEGIEDAMRLFDSRSAIGKLQHHFLRLKLGADSKQASARFFQGIQSVFDNLD